MRLIGTLNNEAHAQLFCAYLEHRGINTSSDVYLNQDWGSDAYGTVTCNIWVQDEEYFDEAMSLLEEFKQNPDREMYRRTSTPVNKSGKPIEIPIAPLNKTKADPKKIGVITLYILLVCAWLYIWSVATAPSTAAIPTNYSALPLTPIVMPQIAKELLFDYPHAYEIIDHLNTLYGTEALMQANTVPLPEEGQQLLQEYANTPYWQGLYDEVLHKGKEVFSSWPFQAPMFEKLRQGEWWRLFTPSFLHLGILHIFFNMVWLVLLGSQIERRLHSRKYLLFIFIGCIIPNIGQYIMSGANFVGFSGVVCAMLGFMWMRKRVAPWEGYNLNRTTIAFIVFYIAALIALQLLSFYMELHSAESWSPGIGNTAHLIGAIVGAFLGRLRFFAWQE